MTNRVSNTRLRQLLANPDPSVRLRTALAAGTHSADEYLDALIDRCGFEPDFFVRDMLTWALTRLPASIVTPRLVAELRSPVPQARAQALHTLSKIGDGEVWQQLPMGLLHDDDDEVARAAWRTLGALVPPGSTDAVAAELVRELGRGDLEVRRSLSRALVALGPVIEPHLDRALAAARPEVREHAAATRRLLADPEAELTLSVQQARVIAAGSMVPQGW